MAPTVNPELQVSVAEVESYAIGSDLVLNGQIVAQNSVRIAAELEGLRIENVHADEGQRVRRGQLLISLDTSAVRSEYQQSLHQADRSSALIAQAAAQYAAARSQSELMQSELARFTKIVAIGAISAADFEARKKAAEQGANALVAAQRAHDAAKAEHAYATAQLRLAAARRDKANILAPTTGVLAERHAIAGSITSSSAEPLFVLHPDGPREFEATLDLDHLTLLQSDTTLRLHVAGRSELFDAKLRIKADSVRAEDRKGVVRFAIADGNALSIGASAQGRAPAAKLEGIWIAHSSVLFDPDPSVFVLNEDQRVWRRNIRVANSAPGAKLQVISGLDAGERVVTSAAALLLDGLKVRPVFAEANLIDLEDTP